MRLLNPITITCTVDSLGRSRLWWATFQGQKDILKLLIKPDTDLDRQENGLLTLQQQPTRNFKFIKILGFADDTMRPQVRIPMTPLWTAAAMGNHEVTAMLIEYGASLEIKGLFGFSPIQIAAYNGHASVVEILVRACADVESKNDKGMTPLLVAAQNGHLGVVVALIKAGAKIESVDSDGRSALLIAASNGHGQLVDVLIRAGANVKRKSKAGWSALFSAMEKGYREVAEILLSEGADVDAKDSAGRTPLCMAAYKGRLSDVEFLINARADVNSLDSQGRSVLMAASYNGHEDVARVLINNGADVSLVGVEGQSALFAAAYNGHRGVSEVLIRSGADIKVVTADGRRCLHACAQNGHSDMVHLLLETGADLDATTVKEGRTALYLAAYAGCLEAVKCLVHFGANINAQDKQGLFTLWAASFNGHDDVVRFLLSNKADIELREGNGRTALYAAAYNGMKKVVEILVKVGAVIDAKDTDGRTPLWIASNKGNADVVYILLASGADVEAVDGQGISALYTAAFNNNVNVVEALVKAGASVEARDQSTGQSVLERVCHDGYTEIVDILINVGVNLQAKSTNGATALWTASYAGHLSVVKRLLAAGVDVEAGDDKGRTPLIAAAYCGHEEVVKELLIAGADFEIRFDGGKTLLWAACHNGHTGVANLLIKAGLDIKAEDDEKSSALLTASNTGQKQTAEFLISAGANILSCDAKGQFPIHAAAFNGYRDIVELLIKTDASLVNFRTSAGVSALLYASYNGHSDVVNLLVEAGADIEVRDHKGWTPLMAASFHGHEDVVDRLIRAGADINARDEVMSSPLTAACSNGHTKIAKGLLIAGADLHAKDKYGQTALVLTLFKGHKEVIDLLISASGCDGFNFVRDVIGQVPSHPLVKVSPLNLLLLMAMQKGNCENMQKLMKSLRVFNLGCDADGEIFLSQSTLFKMAANSGYPSIYRIVMIMGAFDHVQLPPLPKSQSLPFQDVIHYNSFNRSYNVYSFTSFDHILPDFLPLPELIKYPGLGNVEAIPNQTCKVIFSHARQIVEALNDGLVAHKMFKDFNLHGCGSSAEGTSVGFPDELDFLFQSHLTLDEVEIHDFRDGYKYCVRNSRNTSIFSKMEENLEMFCNGSKRYHDDFWKVLERSEAQKLKHVVSVPMVKDGGNASTEILLSWFEPGTKSRFMISVDLVPVIHFKDSWPEEAVKRTWLMDENTLRKNGFSLVAKPPHKDSRMGKSLQESERVKLWRLSFSDLETEHIGSLDPRVKNAYVAAKCLRNPDVCRVFVRDAEGILKTTDKYVTSYLLKTVFLHNVEHFLACKMSLVHMVYAIYSQLEAHLERGFVPLFWQPDVNVLEGLSIDSKKSLQVVRLLKELVECLCLKEEDGQDVFVPDFERETVVYSRNPCCNGGYFAFELRSD